MAIKHKRLFPQALLTQSSTERLNYFQGITIGHLRLKQALDILLMNLQQPTDICVLFVVGPAGVGKTTLRHSTDNKEDIAEFMRVLRTFQAHLPLIEEPCLVEQYEYFLDYSVGSVGLLKTWLTKALRNALAENATTLNAKYIQQNEYSKARRQQIQQEAQAGEKRWHNEVATVTPSLTNEDVRQPSQIKGRVGKRLAKRDPVGINLDVS